MKHLEVYLIRLQKNKFSKPSKSRTYNLPYSLVKTAFNKDSEANHPMFQLVLSSVTSNILSIIT